MYQVIWVRLAYSAFGVISPVLSIVVSVFMLGLALGSWIAGEWIKAAKDKFSCSAISVYALVEATVGLGAFCVPLLYQIGSKMLLSVGESNSTSYLVLSALIICLATLPWCMAMGATFPVMMSYVEESGSNKESFSFLYLANVAGALLGTLLTSFVLIELLGFQGSLMVGAAMNFAVAGIAAKLAWRSSAMASPGLVSSTEAAETTISQTCLNPTLIKLLLFLTGFCSMGMEVVWARAYTPVLGNEVYSFAGLLFFYLLATFAGSWMYRNQLKLGTSPSLPKMLLMLAVFSLVPIILNDPYVHIVIRAVTMVLISGPIGVVLGRMAVITTTLLSIVPFCLTLGFMTPQLIDLLSLGSPKIAGRAYAINIVGCILGPCFASYVLLPYMGPRFALAVLALPLFVLLAFQLKELPKLRYAAIAAAVILLPISLFVCVGYDEFICRMNRNFQVKRDYAATVIASGYGFQRSLAVNGVRMTALDQSTKNMAHLPLVLLKHKPESALVICFGMGTTFKSALSWDIDVTAVELVPSVKDFFASFHDDAQRLLASGKGHILVDDGRRFLNRTKRQFDVIIIDAPPPPEAAGVSLLMSSEFFNLTKQHLKPGGIVHEFVPYGEDSMIQGSLRSLSSCFKYTRVFRIPRFGFHMLGSDSPLDSPSAKEAVAKLPHLATLDLVEWQSQNNTKPEAVMETIFQSEIPLSAIINPDPSVNITDDRPLNEYFLIRRTLGMLQGNTRRLMSQQMTK